LIGGPPCQDFSPARLKREPVEGRASLVLTYIDLLRRLKPRAFLFENVPGLRTADGGRHWARLRKRLERNGYVVQACELNAEDFGVPQRRRRLFVVGLREGEMARFEFPVGRENLMSRLPRLSPNIAAACRGWSPARTRLMIPTIARAATSPACWISSR
jgi:DNA (cytosine-5)-methyltransferase 1